MRKRSLPLVLALVASTSMIVNCQKTPSKRTATTTNGGVGAPDSEAQAAKTAADLKITEECSVEIKNLRKDLFSKMTQFNSQFMNKKIADLSESEKAQLTADSKTIVDSCGTYIEKLKSVNGAGCKDSENKTNPLLVKDSAQRDCEKNGTYLKNLTGQENDLSRQDQKRSTEEGEARAIEKFKRETLVLSKEGRALMTSGGVQWKAFLDMGEIKTSKTELEKLVKDGTTVCSMDKEMDVAESKTAEFQLVSVDENAKNPDGSYEREVPENYENIKSDKVGSVVLTFSRINAGDNAGDLNYLVCVNVKKEKMTAQKIKQVLGKVLKSDTRTEDQRNADKQKAAEEARREKDAQAAKEVQKAKAASETTTVVQKSAVQAADQKTATESLTVKDIKAEGMKYQIIELSDGKAVRIESGKMNGLQKATADKAGTAVVIRHVDGKNYLVTTDNQNSALIIEDKDLKEGSKPAAAAKPAQAAGAPATAASGAESNTVVDDKTGMKMSTTLSSPAAKTDEKSTDSKVVLNEKDIQALRAKFVGSNGVSESLRFVSIVYDSQTRTQKIILEGDTVLTLETSRIVDKNLLDSVVKIEYDPKQKVEKDLVSGKNKIVGLLYLKTGEVIKVTWLKDAKK